MRHSLTALIAIAVACGPDVTPPGTVTGPGNDVDGDGFSIADGDCDDTDETVYPGATDVVGDDQDQNCDLVDGLDDDRDGHAWTGSGGDDCDDADDTVFEGAPEIGWDDVDQDCDGRDRYDWSEVSVGLFHTCGLDTTGTIRCWGSDANLQTSNRPTDAGWEHVCSGNRFSCAVHGDATLACWGDNSAYVVSDAPTAATFDQIVCGENHACALTPEGSATCWGVDSAGDDWTAPGTAQFTSVAAGVDHTCGVSKFDGGVICWGIITGKDIEDVPFQDENLSVVSGANHGCVLRSDLGLDCWGDDNGFAGSPGDPTAAPSDAGPYSLLAAGKNTSCGIFEGQELSCWGDDTYFQLSDAPYDTDVHYVAIREHGCVIRNDDDEMECWGRDLEGQTAVPWP